MYRNAPRVRNICRWLLRRERSLPASLRPRPDFLGSQTHSGRFTWETSLPTGNPWETTDDANAVVCKGQRIVDHSVWLDPRRVPGEDAAGDGRALSLSSSRCG